MVTDFRNFFNAKTQERKERLSRLCALALMISKGIPVNDGRLKVVSVRCAKKIQRYNRNTFDEIIL
jgi:hypothetical protein